MGYMKLFFSSKNLCFENRTKKIHRIKKTSIVLTNFLKYLLLGFYIFWVFRVIHCVRIRISFYSEDCLNGFMPNSSDSYPLESNIKENSGNNDQKLIFQSTHYTLDLNNVQIFENEQNEDRNMEKRYPRLYTYPKLLKNTSDNSLDEISSTVHFDSHISHDTLQNYKESYDFKLDCNLDDSKSESKSSQIKHDFIIFDYSEKCIIRSKYFDKVSQSGLTEINLNIKNITKSNIDCCMCRECLQVLCYGWTTNFFNMKNEQFLDYIWFIYDLSCYSTSIALYKLYENLIPFLISYLESESGFYELYSETIQLSEYRNLFLPFLPSLYNSVFVFFNSSTKELLLIDKKQNDARNRFENNLTEKMSIRTTTKTLDIINEDTFKEKTKFLCKLIFSFEINELKISYDDNYFTECKDSNTADSFNEKNAEISKIETCFSSVFNYIEPLQSRKIESIEFERICLSTSDAGFLFSLNNLQSLILVKCQFENHSKYLCTLSAFFLNLKTLRIIGFRLRNSFFNNLNKLKNLTVLDLSWCIYSDSSNKLFMNPLPNLKESRIDYSNFNYKIINCLIKNNKLNVLSLRGMNFSRLRRFEDCAGWSKSYHSLDLSKCKLNETLSNFFSTNIKCKRLFLEHFLDPIHSKKILNQESLYSSTTYISLSGGLLSADLFVCLNNFYKLKYLNLSNFSEGFLEYSYENQKFEYNSITSESSENRDSNVPAVLSNKKASNKELSLKTKFFECLCATDLTISLEKINLAGNNLSESDIYQIELFVNLKYIIISFDDKVFSRALLTYGAIKCPKVETMIIISTNINSDIYNFIMKLPSLRNLELQECEIFMGVLTSYLSSYPIFLEKVILTNTNLSAEDKAVLELLNVNGVEVTIE
ncbi:hypothetical protein LUQ84_001060 [Hamiltosporidium tvaerminnensis]|nr:hypothetical protein LUQ84_001060 [Hamiltosporidium tvaerminnensis]